ncbi:MAG: hypothetical protein M0Z33_05090 [Actinomycetota bacterium]|nr:hypothetical protein [Actinomycetota bacterium]
MERLLAPVVSLLLLAATVPGIPAAEAGASVPAVLTCAGRTVVRPAGYVLACADANTYFTSMHWTSWTRTTASASATFVANDCAPTCVGGTFVRYPATVTLASPKVTAHGLLFTVLRYRYTTSRSTTLPVTTLADLAGARPRCSTDPTVAARFGIPPPPFAVRAVSVARDALPSSEARSTGASYERLYRVSFTVTSGNAVLPAGHRYTQFSYVVRSSTRRMSRDSWNFGDGPVVDQATA